MIETEILKEFQTYLETSNKSPKTIRVYNYYLIDFIRFFMQKNSIKNFSKIFLFNVSKDDILDYLYFLMQEKGNKSSIRHSKIIVLKKFYKWLLVNNPELENPTEGIDTNLSIKRLPKVLSLEQAKKLQEFYVDNKKKLIINILLQTGIRVNEITHIETKNIDYVNNTIKIIAKGRKERVVFINPSLMDQIKTFQNGNISKYLFTGNKGKCISNRTVQRIVENASRELGFKGCTTHTLRHTFATVIYSQTKDILLTKNLLGHESLVSTQIYTHILSENVKKAIKSNPLSDFQVERRNTNEKGSGGA